MLRFAQTADLIAATSSKLAKVKLVADYFRSLTSEQAALAAIFLSGRPFAAYEQATLQVGGSLLWRVIAELSGKSERDLSELYRRHGDAGAVAADALPSKPQADLSLADVQHAFREIGGARGPAPKAHILRQLLERATPLEAKYIVKIITGDLRVGLKESLVEEAIGQAFEQPAAQVQRANMLLGDIGDTLRLAAAGKLAEARLRLFHPMDFMLASPVDSAEEALSYFEDAKIEDKYDGIRAHAHVGRGEVRLFSRTRDEITESFPELVPVLGSLPCDAIFDGEIVAWSSQQKPGGGMSTSALGSERATAELPSAEQTSSTGRALPFSALQRRLGRKKVSDKLVREIPVAYLIFDLLFANGQLLLERPLRERAEILNQLLALPRRELLPPSSGQATMIFAEADKTAPGHILRAPTASASSTEDLERLFIAARDRGNEGLMIKDRNSLYTPGRRGKSWLKMKRELATLDVVVTAVEYGHGKRIGVLSDYTFAVWDEDRLVNIGKAYSGLTDAEIAEMTKWFLNHKIREQGLRLEVEPKIVIEVAFNNMMRSTRHESGYALRFPRIVRLRLDKPAEDADTIQTVHEIFNRQHGA
ncbi:MAG: ATP-dependent DNA ligase [Terriglobales bacterium]